MKIFKNIFVGLLLIFIFTLTVDNVLAIKSGTLPGGDCGSADNPCFAPPDTDEVPEELQHAETPRQAIMRFIDYILGFTGLIAVTALIYSGFLWVTSLGNEEQFEKGKKGTLYAFLGIILILLSYTLVKWIIDFGTHSDQYDSSKQKSILIQPSSAEIDSGKDFVFSRQGNATGEASWLVEVPEKLICNFNPNLLSSKIGDQLNINCLNKAQEPQFVVIKIMINLNDLYDANGKIIQKAQTLHGRATLRVNPEKRSSNEAEDSDILIEPQRGIINSGQDFTFTRQGNSASKAVWQIDSKDNLDCSFQPLDGVSNKSGDQFKINCKNHMKSQSYVVIKLQLENGGYSDKATLEVNPTDIFITPPAAKVLSDKEITFSREGKENRKAMWSIQSNDNLPCIMTPENGISLNSKDTLKVKCTNETEKDSFVIVKLSLWGTNYSDKATLTVKSKKDSSDEEEGNNNQSGKNDDNEENNGNNENNTNEKKYDDDTIIVDNNILDQGTSGSGDNDLYSSSDFFATIVDDVIDKGQDLDPRNTEDFKRSLTKLFEITPHTEEFNKSYQEVLNALDKWIADPDNPKKEAAFKNALNKLIDIVNSFPRMKANIAATPTSGNAPLYVSLNGLESLDPLDVTIPDKNYHWNFVDNTGKNVDLGSGPVKDVVFENPGTYIVRLKVKTVEKKDNVKAAIDGVDNVRIIVYPAVSLVDFKINGEKVGSIYKITSLESSKGLIIDPSPTVIAEGRLINEWLWDFGDGVVESRTQLESITHPFSNRGDYRLKLTIKDNTGEKKSKEVLIKVQNAVAKINLTPENGTVINNFIFDASSSRSSEGQIKSFYWKIVGKENFETDQKNFSRKFTIPGEYEVQLTVEDEFGKSAIQTQKFKVLSQKPFASFTSKIPHSYQPAKVRFDANSSSDPDNDSLLYSWDFDSDGIFEIQDSKEAVVHHNFTEAKNFKTKLTIKDPFGESDTISKNIEIDSTFEVDFTASSIVSYVEQEITFNAISPQAIGFLWDFDDGTVETTSQLAQKHTFKKEGKYRVKLTVTNIEDEENFIEKWIHVGEKDHPVAVIEVSRDNIFEMIRKDLCGSDKNGLEVLRSNLISLSAGHSINKDGKKDNLSFQWDFHDGTFATGMNIKKTFTEISLPNSCQPITLIVTDDQTGASSSETIFFQVKNAPPVFEQFVINPPHRIKETPISIPLSALGASDKDGTIVQFKWWAERESDPSEKMDLHTTSDSSTTIVILPRGHANQINRWKFFVELKDDSGDMITNEELFGPSMFVDVKNNKNLAPVVDFRMDKSTIKMGDTITFVADARDPQGEEILDNSFKWDFNGDNFFDDVSSGPTVTHRFDMPGEYEVRLKVVNRGLTTSKVRKIFVERVSRVPLAAFTFTTSGRKVIFDAKNSKFDSSIQNNELSLIWDFDINKDSNGDGVKDNDKDSTKVRVEHIYDEEDRFKVKLTVKDIVGSNDTVLREVDIRKTGQVNEKIETTRSIQIDSKNVITTLTLLSTKKIILKGQSSDIFTFIKNADGSAFSGKVKFEILEGAGDIMPQQVDAKLSEAATTFHATSEGKVVIKATALKTVSGDISEVIVVFVR